MIFPTLRSSIVALAALWATGCQSGGLYLANLFNDTSTYSVQHDVSYGDATWQTLDVYTPTAGNAPYPVIVFYYGGGWTSGDKSQYAFIANRLVRDGFIVIIPNYTKYPPSTYPSYQHDAALVTSWLNISMTTINARRDAVHLLGHSAGAHIGAMLLADHRFLAKHALTPSFYASFTGIAGPYNFTPAEEPYQTIFGPENNYPAMQTSHFIDGNEPPMLLINGADDEMVGISNTVKLEAAINAASGSVTTKRYDGFGHISIIGSFSATFPLDDSIAKDAVTFMRSHQPL